MPLASLLHPDQVHTDLKVGSVSRLLERMAMLLAVHSTLDVADLAQALRTREELSSTALGNGLALPHAAIPGLREARMAFARLSTPLNMGAPDGRGVDLVCALIVPDSFIDGKLRLLAEVAEKLETETHRQRLRQAADPAALHALLTSG